MLKWFTFFIFSVGLPIKAGMSETTKLKITELNATAKKLVELERETDATTIQRNRNLTEIANQTMVPPRANQPVNGNVKS